MESITLDVWPHPLTAESRTTRLLPWRSGLTVAHVLALAPPALRPEDVLLEADGTPASPDDPLRPGSVLVVRARAGRGLRTILQLATIVASIYVPGLPAFAAWSAFGRAALAAGIQISAQLVTNALVPPRLDSTAGEEVQRPVPVYSIRGGRNLASPWGSLQWVLGEHRIFPDLTVQYVYVLGNDEHLAAIYDLGLGDLEYDVTDLQIGETQILNFPGVGLKWGLNGGRIIGIGGNSHQLPVGVDLDDTTRWAIRVTAKHVDQFVVDLSGTIFSVNDSGGLETRQVQIELGWRPIPTEAAPSPAWSSTVLVVESDTQTPIRRSIRRVVAKGQYEIRVRRRSAVTESARARDQVQWTSLTSFGADAASYAGRNRLGIDLLASGQIHGPVDRLSIVLRQKIPAWEANVWVKKYSSNPAWIFRYVAIGLWIGSQADGTRRLLAGAGLDVERIDDETLKRWGAWCDAEGLTCNLVVRGESTRDVLDTVAACGRATLTWASGRLGVVWDADDKPVSALVTPAQIVRHSYRVDWLASQDVADEVHAVYIDAAAGYERRELRQRIPLAGTAIRSSAYMRLDGVTDRSQAVDFVNRQAARQLRRRRHEWEMPIGALPAARGDVVWVSHSLVDGGQTGRLAAISETREVITLPEPIDLTVGAQMIVSLPDGRLYQSTSLAAGDSGAATVRLDPPLPAPPSPDEPWEPMDCLWRYYETSARLAVQIVEIVPSAEGTVRITAIDYTSGSGGGPDSPGDYTWDDLTTWDEWLSWDRGLLP